MLALKNINVSLGKDTKLERQVLNGLNLTLKNKEFVVIVGSNGAGKSTILNIVSGVTKPDYGEVILDNVSINKMPQNTISGLIAKVAQDPKIGTMENMTIFENMEFALKRGQNRGFTFFNKNNRKQLFIEKLAILDMGLENRLDELVVNLSGGQRQALSLIMAIIADYEILLLDEITAALDPKIAEKIMTITNKIVRLENRICIMITHNMADAIKYGDRTAVLKNGKFIKECDLPAKQNLSQAELMEMLE
ncbi:MAG: ATP-binding cassette domain-containing protein [Rickettsiaceae bacterium]|nr:ATP-binding cassette domain-containing protein [Rickettsiaceae bacterium]